MRRIDDSNDVPEAPRTRAVTDWLVHEGRLAANAAVLLDGLCGRLQAQGLDVLRMNVQLRTLHPEVAVLLYVWRPIQAPMELNSKARVVERSAESLDHGVVEHLSLAHGAFAMEAFRASPFYAVHCGAPRVRCPIEAVPRSDEYPILANLRDLGATDYVAFPLQFNGGVISAVSWVTKKAGGFTDGELATLEALLPALTLCLEIHVGRHTAHSLLTAYVGREAGERVLGGKFRRGDVERVEAAIWFSDLRGFTHLSTSLDSAELILWLNEYFGAIAGPIATGGGEILKFIGDAVLAVFPINAARSAAEVTARALDAARRANVELDALNLRRAERGLASLEHGIALHVGEVQYGNIGAERRLDFTVIGQAVNLASRIEGLCGKLGRRTLVSSTVAAVASEGLERLGSFELKGIATPQEIFGVRA